MKRIIRLTERDLTRIVKRVINEQIETRSTEHQALYDEAINLLDVLTFDELKSVIPDIRKKSIRKVISRGKVN